MYKPYNKRQCPYFLNTATYNSDGLNYPYRIYPCPYYFMCNPEFFNETDFDSRFDSSKSAAANDSIELKDYGPEPFVININEATKQNDNYRTALWTGSHLQVTLMSIPVGGDIGLEIHPNLDQFIRIEQGQGIVKMGDSKDRLDFQERVYDDFAFVIPAGKWHNLINTGYEPLKLYSIYAPPQHPHGTVHVTKADAEAAEDH